MGRSAADESTAKELAVSTRLLLAINIHGIIEGKEREGLKGE
jgi:hypothetical protein